MIDASTIALIGAASSAVIASCTVITFWIKFAQRVSAAETSAADAARRADESNKLAADAHNRVTHLAAEFGLYRENVARDYIHKETMREVEDRLTKAIDRLGDRLDSFLQRAPTG